MIYKSRFKSFLVIYDLDLNFFLGDFDLKLRNSQIVSQITDCRNANQKRQRNETKIAVMETKPRS